eukprot:160817_1
MSSLQSSGVQGAVQMTGQPLQNIQPGQIRTLKLCFLALIASARDPAMFFAHTLREAMKGLGTNDRALIRVITTRSEIDLGAIKEEFAIKSGRQLRKWVQDDCSGDYEDLLIALMNGKQSY